jgi:5-methyltetrahydropteroyltriglutamate--homocysteine methyltransferase
LNPRHARDLIVVCDSKPEITDHKILVSGVIDTTTNFIEHPQLVAQRVERFTATVGSDRVIAGSDCGFGPFAGYGAVDRDIAYAKLAALSEGAALVGAAT